MPKAMIPVASITVDLRIHPRMKLDEATAEEYGRLMKDGAKFPPIIVFHDGKEHFLADGWHRLEGVKSFAGKDIAADVRKGSRRDAILYAVAANHKHGLRRTNADKRKAVEIVLDDEEWRLWAVNKIASLCNVSWTLVDEIRKSYLLENEDSDERKVERGGTEFHQKVGKRGGSKKALTPVGMVVQAVDVIAQARMSFRGREDKYGAKIEDSLHAVMGRLRALIGEATGAVRMTKGLRMPLNVYQRPRKGGIQATPEFAKKKLCNYAVNVGMACGHQCTYCSSPSLRRTHDDFKDIEQTSFQRGFAIVDPNTPERIRRDVRTLTADDTIQLCTMDDAWSPEAKKYDLGRKCLEILLDETPAQVRILTKNAAVADDFDILKKHKERVIVGLSTGIPASREDAAAAVEPNASPIKDRLAALKKAKKMGLRTYGMLCPCLPGIADSRDALEEMFAAVLECGVEDIWLEPVNARGPGLAATSLALRDAGLDVDAQAIDTIKKTVNWSPYAAGLIETAIDVAKNREVLDRLHILLYLDKLTTEDTDKLKRHKQGIIWLEKKEAKARRSMTALESKRAMLPLDSRKTDVKYIDADDLPTGLHLFDERTSKS